MKWELEKESPVEVEANGIPASCFACVTKSPGGDSAYWRVGDIVFRDSKSDGYVHNMRTEDCLHSHLQRSFRYRVLTKPFTLGPKAD